jgi:cellulose synthase/poly-beta-1,6-N-acetylglucosamine synthase-like glycosyltransferase/spore germination protein YaaH/peptidoglycan/xylan/chitin deacetylase (PgdA/CDA1 family)
MKNQRLHLLSLLFRLTTILLLLGVIVPALFPLLGLPFPYSINMVTLLTATAIIYALFTWLYYKETQKYEEKEQPFIFYDNSGLRWHFLKRFITSCSIISVVILTIFGFSLHTDPFLPELSLGSAPQFHNIRPIIEKIKENSLVSQLKQDNSKHSFFHLEKKHKLTQDVASALSQKEVYGFYVNWDENSKVSLKRNIHSLQTVIPEWYHIKPDFTLKSEVQQDVKNLVLDNNVKLMPLVNNFIGGKWDTDTIHNLLNSPAGRAAFIQRLYNEAKTNGYTGFNIDFESIKPEDQDNVTAFMTELYNKFHANGLEVTQDVPADDEAFDYGALSKVTDRMIVMLYDEHYQTGKPGPIASDSWFEHSLEQLDIPPEKLIVSLGNYGYDWIENSNQPADTMTFGDIMDMGAASQLKIQWDETSGNPYVRYIDGHDKHIVWFLDAVSLYNELKTSMDQGAKGVALWRLGSEDPSVWNLLKQPDHLKEQAQSLHSLSSPELVRYAGEGEILRVLSSSQDGKREFTIDEDGTLSGESYTSYPVPFQVERYGKAAGKKVVLTFDDGPDPVYTPKILDILDRYHIKGAFFIVGENAELHPELVSRMYREGHEIGNHTFTHPNVAETSPRRTKMELNANQRLFQSITGHSMTMFRPPYVADASPSTPEELLPILRAQKMGYTMIGESIDPEDWAKPSSDEIVRRVLKELPDGNIILLHDAGGDRSQTVEALPKIIEALKQRGYSFISIEQLLGKKKEEIMPPVEHIERPFVTYDQAVFTAVSDWQQTLSILFALSIGIGIIRFLVLLYLASKQKQKRKRRSEFTRGTYTPSVSVVIAAYNEEKVIEKTVHSILGSDYPSFNVIVVDDGSTDNTSRVIQEAFGYDTRVRLITKENGGKSSAINRGIMEAEGEIIVALDADTVIASDAISLLARHFSDENVAAVSGNVKVGNVRNLLTRWQHVEYVTGFNLDRRAFDQLNCIVVVPGAIGAWRKEAVARAGYFKDDTLAEDTDLTLTLLRNGGRVLYEEGAIAYTEAPEDVHSLLKQRYRWTYGTLQCLWKHRKALFNRRQPSLGFIGLPNMWLFQYVFQAIAPLADILFVLGLFGIQPGKTACFYILFFLIDLLASLYAFRLEGENPRPLCWLFLQRIVYRQFMTYVVLKSITSALKGVVVGWNKLQRLGSVTNK